MPYGFQFKESCLLLGGEKTILQEDLYQIGSQFHMEWLLIFFKNSDIIKNGHIWALSVKTMPYKSLETPLKHLGK